jgi:outer membrane protein assembly factor BamE
MRKILIAALFCLSFGMLFGCSALKPYHVEVQQGNVLDQSAIQRLEIGMSRSEVVATLGTPILGQAFENNVLTYVYTDEKGKGGTMNEKMLVLRFAKNRLASIQIK